MVLVFYALPQNHRGPRKYSAQSGSSRTLVMWVCVCVCVCPSGRIHVAACGPIGTKFGTRVQIHLEMVVGSIKLPLSDLGGMWGVLGGHKCKIWNSYQTTGSIVTRCCTHVRIHRGMDIG